MTDKLTDNIDRVFRTLKLGEAYWSRGYIKNMQHTLLDLRNQKACWIGSIENNLKLDVDRYLRDCGLTNN